MNVFGDATYHWKVTPRYFTCLAAYRRWPLIIILNSGDTVPGTKNNKYHFFNRQAKPILKHILVNCIYNFLELLLDLS